MLSHTKNHLFLAAFGACVVAGISFAAIAGEETSQPIPLSQQASSKTTPNPMPATKERDGGTSEPIVLRLHGAGVGRCRFCPDNKKVVTASNDGVCRIWDAEKGTLLRTLRGHSASVTRVDISGDSNLIATSARDGTVRLWDAVRGRPLFTFPVGKSGNSAVQFSSDGSKLLIGKSDGEVSAWNTSTGELKQRYCETGYVNCLQDAFFALDEKYVIAHNAKEQAIFIWEEATGRLVKELQTSGLVYVPTITPDGKRVLAGDNDGRLWQWDYESGESEGYKSEHHASLWRLSFSPNGQLLLTGSLDGDAKIWDYKTGKVVRTLSHGDGVVTAIFSPDGKTVLTASYDWTARLWDVESGRMLREFNAHTDELRQAAFSPDGKKFITASGDTTAQIHTL